MRADETGVAPTGERLNDYLRGLTSPNATHGAAVEALIALADAGRRISKLVAHGPLGGAMGASTGVANSDGEQKALDVLTNDIVAKALAGTRTAYFASEEEDSIRTLSPDGLIAVAVDPLDGSSNIDVNGPIGTIFSLLPVSAQGDAASFFRPASDQIAAGYIVYGSHTVLVLTMGAGVDLFVLDRETDEFFLVQKGIRIPHSTSEFAINASNYHQWHEPVRTFIDDCLSGKEGPRGKAFNMRWLASVVGEAHRIFCRGGIYLYPADRRPGYERGRLRLLYEAAPLAMLVEQAGGGATDGSVPILSKTPQSLHERTPLVFGSKEKVERVTAYHHDSRFEKNQSPLFGNRGLYRG